jgi:sugar lactone lactonase YvrE
MARFKVAASLPSPGPAPHGLAYDGESLWVSDRSEQRIYKLNPDSGQILLAIPFDGDVAGTAWDGKHLWQADNRTKTISQIDTETGSIHMALSCDTGSGVLGGICHDGQDLWVAVTGMGQLRRVRPADGAIIKTHPARKNICGVGFDGRRIWYSDVDMPRLRKVDPATGTELMSYEFQGMPTGIAFVRDSMFYCDAAAKKLHKMQVVARA